MIEAILFGISGTLTDYPRTLARLAQRFSEHFADHLLTIASDRLERTLRLCDGGGYRAPRALYADLQQRLPWQVLPSEAELRAFWESTLPAVAQPQAGLLETLGALRQQGIQLGVIGNGLAVIEDAILDQLGLRDLLEVVVLAERVGVRKPDPRIFQLALVRLGALPERCLFVGHHPVADVIGAHASGIISVWFSGGFDWPGHYPEPEFVIGSLPELLPLAAKA